MSEIDFKKIICPEKGCTVSVDGKCLEGRPLSECTHHRPISESEDIDEVPEEDSSESDNQETSETAHSGDALSLVECRTITAAAPTRVIVLAGSVDAGKTTLLASLFELFQGGSSFAGYMFAGSRTLIGFEKRCHDSRISSERNEPQTERTKYTPDDPKFLHLKTKNIETENIRNVLFTDISGEHFRQLSNSTEECKKFIVGKRADHFALFIDADMLSDSKNRQTAKTSAFSILRGLTESGTLTPSTLVEIVFSRWDLLELKGDQNNMHLKFIESIKSELKSKYPENRWDIRFFKTASRPKKGSTLNFGYGIDELMKIWIEETSYFIPQENVLAEKKSSERVHREYINYQLD